MKEPSWPVDAPGQTAAAVAEPGRAELPDGWSASVAITEAVGRVLDRDPLDLEPLAEVTDPESLERILRAWAEDESAAGGMVKFDYSDCVVCLHCDGDMIIRHGDECYNESWLSTGRSE